MFNRTNFNTYYIFINEFNLFTLVIILLSLFHSTECLYEDQIGKFDWKQNFIGKIKYSYFDVNSNDKLIVATEENVLAALNAKSGDILWRQIFEKNPRGDIKLLYVNGNQKSVSSINSNAASTDIITVSGYNPALIRSWNSNTGNAISEWFLTPIIPEKAEHSIWFYRDNYIYYVIPVWGSHLEVTAYHPSTGQSKKSTASKILASWISKENCVLSEPFFACLISNQLIAVDLTSDKSDLFSKPLNDNSGTLQAIKGLDSAVIIGNDIVSLKDLTYSTKVKTGASVYNEKSITNSDVILQAYINENSIHITATKLQTGELINDINTVTDYPATLGRPEINTIKCRSKTDGQQLVCRILLTTDDGSLVLIQQGNIKWTREEALANIVAVEMIDLPLSDAEGAIESELNSKEGDIYGALIRRITGQVSHVKNLILTVLGLGAQPSASQKAGLVRDAFGLHKMIVIVTSTGKIFGIDNISGKHHWIKYLPNFIAFNNEENMKLLIQRTSKHFPFLPQCVIVGKNKLNGHGILYQFNPITGQPINGGIIEQNYSIKQIGLLRETEHDFLRGILLLDQYNKVHVLPDIAKKYADKYFIYTANKNTGELSGYYVEYENEQLSTSLTWQINLSGPSNSQKIIMIASKNSIEHVHSQGRVLGDRSVLYKYINPNLVAVATHGLDSIHKYILNIHLIDVVSGAIVFAMTHRRVKGPLYMVHSENWLVYSYYNEKVRRTEITTVELYEGKTQTNSTVWSSLEAPPPPLVERQAYVFPSNIAALRETITEKGITNKHVLVALTSGGIMEIPWIFLDPRRPVTMPNQAREEGIIPYIPELPFPHENIINYNQSVANINGIYTAPSGLESTCLVFAYGLDIFVTRIAPSKTFDLLKEDFDYFLISVVLIALTTASYVVKHLSSRKALKQAWK